MNTKVRKKIQSRKYGVAHQRLRAAIAPQVNAGIAKCARCGRLIEPGQRWHLGHDDHNSGLYSGPEHGWCNEGAPHRNVTSTEWS